MPLTRNQSNAASQAKLAADNSETSTSKETGEQGAASGDSEPPRRDSPENCSICLGPFNNKSFTSSCAHSFCFVCLKQWSKVKAECPLCKQPFTSIFHNIRSNQLYEIYEVPHQPNNQIDYNVFNYVGAATIPTFTGPQHLFMSRPAFDADLTLSNFSRFQFRHRRYDRYLNPQNIHGEHPYSFNGPAVNPTSHISAATWPRGEEEFRREVYRRNIGPPAVILGCENSTYRLTPAMVAASAHRIHRIMPWLTRELRVLLRSHQNVRLTISVIQPLLTQVTVDSVYFYDKIVPLIGHRSRQFVQEFVAFANSALSMQAYDRKAMYRRREAAPAVSSLSSSPSSDNDVVEVTDISPDVYPIVSAAGPSAQTQPAGLGQSGWDSPTPGPSWSGFNVPNANNQVSVIDRVSVSSESDDPVYRPDLRVSDSDGSKAGSDIIFVKYDKPWNERSPINLTSDSETEAAAGGERARKKKKSKHKKKKKESVDSVTEGASGKKEKSRKSKHRDKSKGSSKAASEEDQESGACSKRHHSQSSTEQHKVKKHKKSKGRKERLSDREIVDRYFAEAMAHAEKEGNPTNSDGKEAEATNKRKEKEKSGNTTSRDKTKKKKKNRKHSRDSHNQSHAHTYKKHHSGHKKSSNRLTDNLPESHRRHLRKSPIRGEGVGLPGRSSRHDSAVNDSLSRQDSASGSVSHPVVPGFQPPYLAMTDTVQHIPVNLWVSTWPTLSVSHYNPPPPPPPPPPASSTVSQSMPQTSNTPAVPSGSPGPGKYPSDMLSISSDSSSDSSDSESDDAQDLHIPSLQNVHSRTKQWLENNFPDLGRPQPSSAPASSTASSSTNDYPSSSAPAAKPLDDGGEANEGQTECHNNPGMGMSNKDKDVDVEVVSIPSGEEDVVVCSSDDSSSHTGDLWVVDNDQSKKKSSPSRKSKTDAMDSSSSDKNAEKSGASNISTLPFVRGKSKSSSSLVNNILLPSANKSFQPFRLQKISALSRDKDPFFPPMTHSSDEDGEVDTILHNVTSSSFLDNLTSQIVDSSVFPLSKPKDKATFKLDDIINPCLPSAMSVTNPDPVPTLPESTDSPSHSNLFQPQTDHTTTAISAVSAPLSTETSPMFPVLPPLAASNTPTTSVLSSGINYLPFSNIPASTSVPSLLPSYIPQRPVPPSLPHHFPFPQVPPLLTSQTQPNTMFTTLYTPQNENDSTKQSDNLNNGNVTSNPLHLDPGSCNDDSLSTHRPATDDIDRTMLETSCKPPISVIDGVSGNKINSGQSNHDGGEYQAIDSAACTSPHIFVQNKEESFALSQKGNERFDGTVAQSGDGGDHIPQIQEHRPHLFDFLDPSFEKMPVSEEGPNDVNSVLHETSACVDGASVVGTRDQCPIGARQALELAVPGEAGGNEPTNVSPDYLYAKNCTVFKDSLELEQKTNHQQKPFDVLESLSVNVPLQNTAVPELPPSVIPQVTPAPAPAMCVVTTVADRFEHAVVLDSTCADAPTPQALVSSCQPSPTPKITSSPIEMPVAKSNLLEMPTYKPFSDSDNNPVFPFKDALASSGTSSDDD